MNAQQRRKAERKSAIVGYLKTSGARMTASEIHKELSALESSSSSIQEYLRELVTEQEIHAINESRAGSNGAPKVRYSFGPGSSCAQSNVWLKVDVISAHCNRLGVKEWPRGQHGRDVMVAAFFGGANV